MAVSDQHVVAKCEMNVLAIPFVDVEIFLLLLLIEKLFLPCLSEELFRKPKSPVLISLVNLLINDLYVYLYVAVILVFDKFPFCHAC